MCMYVCNKGSQCESQGESKKSNLPRQMVRWGGESTYLRSASLLLSHSVVIEVREHENGPATVATWAQSHSTPNEASAGK